MKDDSLHPLKPRVVNNIDSVQAKGLIKTEDKLFFDTVKQLISQFRKNFDASQNGGDQQKRENQFIDFTYKRISSQLSKINLEEFDYKSSIDECFKLLKDDIKSDVDLKIKTIIEESVKKYVETHCKKQKQTIDKDTSQNKNVNNNSNTDINIEQAKEDDIINVFDDILNKNDKRFEEIKNKHQQQNKEFNEKIVQLFKNNLIKYSDKQKSNKNTQVVSHTPQINIGQKEKGEKVSETKKSIIPIKLNFRGILSNKNKQLEQLKQQEQNRKKISIDVLKRLFSKDKKRQEQSNETNNIPKAFNTINNVNQDKNNKKDEDKQENKTQQIKSRIIQKKLDTNEKEDKEEQTASDSLVSRYYNKAKRSYIFNKIGKFFSWSKNIFIKALLPLRIVGKILKPLKDMIFHVAKDLLKITKIIISNTFEKIFKVMLLTPQGMYAIGFVTGFIINYVKQKWENRKDDDSYLGKFMKWIGYFFEYVVTPMFEITKSLFKIVFKIVSRIVEFAFKHPKLTLFIIGAIKFLQNIKGIRTTVNVARMVGGSPFNALLGIGAALATEAIMGGLFKSKSEGGMELTIKSLKNFETAGKFMNNSAVADLNPEDLQKLNEINDRINNEYGEVSTLTEDLNTLIRLKVSHSKGKYEREDVDQNLGDAFLKRVFDSYVFGFDKANYNNFKKRQESNTLDQQIQILLGYLTRRVNKIVIIKSSFQESTMMSGDPRDNLSRLINNMYIEGSNGMLNNDMFAKSGLENTLGYEMNTGGVRNKGIQLLNSMNSSYYKKADQSVANHIIVQGDTREETSSLGGLVYNGYAVTNSSHGYRYSRNNGYRGVPDSFLKGKGDDQQFGDTLQERLYKKYKKMDQQDKDIFRTIEAEDIVDRFRHYRDEADADRILDELMEDKRNEFERQRKERTEKIMKEELKRLTDQDKDIKGLNHQKEELEKDIEELKRIKGVKE